MALIHHALWPLTVSTECPALTLCPGPFLVTSKVKVVKGSILFENVEKL